jgi:hypothetical protein
VLVAGGYGALALVMPLVLELSIGGKIVSAVLTGVLYTVLVWRLVLDAKDRSYVRQIRPWALRPEVSP